MSEFSVGQKVWTGVHVYGRWNRMASGVVVADRNGYYDVDIMSHHGGSPWVTQHVYLEPRTESPLKEGKALQ